MVAYILLILIIINLSTAIAIFFNRKIEETFFLSIFAKVLILFIFGIFNSLKIGFYFILFLNVILLGYNIFKIYKEPKIIKNNLLTMGSIFFVITYFYCGLV